ncbi:Uncharacterised protein [Raoultella terrigena]|uniref:Uncharacterized protein n=1 Tax=Raoultella terrigena TaxID=577 RepID=A0A4V6J235_RAOTE|nr:Uncharacterised protein [Raoultella terrigena]
MAVTNKKPILVDQPILEGLQRLRDDECRVLPLAQRQVFRSWRVTFYVRD